MHRAILRSAVLCFLSCATVVGAPRAHPPADGDPAPPDSGSAPLFEAMDVFHLEWASDPRISRDGESVVYVRNWMDVMADRRRSNLWTLQVDGSEHRPLTSGARNDHSPRWSPDGRRLAYVSNEDGASQIYVRWLDTGQTAQLTQADQLEYSGALSPDGRWLAFSMHVPSEPSSFAELPKAPDGAEWAPAATVIDRVHYRADGAGYLEAGHTQLFVVPAEGGTPRQLTHGPWDHGGRLAWLDAERLLFSANRAEGAELDPQESELYELHVPNGKITQRTTRVGPDHSPAVAGGEGESIAWLGFDDRVQGYQVTQLYATGPGGEPSLISTDLDRSVAMPTWLGTERIAFLCDNHGSTELRALGVSAPDSASPGEGVVLATDLGGTSLGRPYGGASFTVSANGRFATIVTSPEHPADVAVGGPGIQGSLRHGVRRLTHLNEELLAHRSLAEVEEPWSGSTHDQRRVQAWLALPSDAARGADKDAPLPMILEIHGGPFANYGPRFAAEIQLYAAAGYAVLYVNPRGSTSYGEEFGNLIHHAYPGHDYDDLMSAVDAVLARGDIDPERLFVTGGSGGGVLSAWIVGKTQRFRAAVVAKPVIHWASFVLTADAYPFFWRYWFPGPPWEHPEHYWARSPLSLVGSVETPTMLLTGEQDFRTPISESEQFYQALKLRGIDTMMVRIPEASHGIANRPSQLIAKVAHVLAWFARHDLPKTPSPR